MRRLRIAAVAASVLALAAGVDRSIDTGQDLLSLDVTDDGVAFTTFDGGLWFTDGSTIEQIGATAPGSVSSQGVAWVRTADPTTGSSPTTPDPVWPGSSTPSSAGPEWSSMTPENGDA
jgi:hypothetical protein